MSAKRKREESTPESQKRARKVMSLVDKIRILDLLETRSNSEVGRLFGVNESTIRSIKKSEESIRESAKSGTAISLQKTHVPRHPRIEKMEEALNLWLQDLNKKRLAVNTYLMQQKALKLYNHFAYLGESSTSLNVVEQYSLTLHPTAERSPQ